MVPILVLNVIVNYLAKHAKAAALVVAFLLWFNNFIEWIFNVVVAQLKELASSLDVAALQGASFANLEWIGYVNAVVPVSEFVTLGGVYTTAVIVIILIRWLKSFVPTLSN